MSLAEQLMEAADKGDVQAAERLSESATASDFEYQNKGKLGDSCTALMLASYRGHAKIVRIFIASGADVNTKDRDWARTAIMYAASKGHVDVVDSILAAKPAEVNGQNSHDQRTALMLAAAKGHAPVVRSLLQCTSIDPNVQDKEGMSALMLAVYEGHEAAALSLLESEDVKLDLQNKRGKTALMWASRDGYTEVVRALLTRGADAAIKNNSGKTAVQVAKNEAIKTLFRTPTPAVPSVSSVAAASTTAPSTTDSAASVTSSASVAGVPSVPSVPSVSVAPPPAPVEATDLSKNSPKKDSNVSKNKDKVPAARIAHTVYPSNHDMDFAMESPMLPFRRQSNGSTTGSTSGSTIG